MLLFDRFNGMATIFVLSVHKEVRIKTGSGFLIKHAVNDILNKSRKIAESKIAMA